MRNRPWRLTPAALVNLNDVTPKNADIRHVTPDTAVQQVIDGAADAAVVAFGTNPSYTEWNIGGPLRKLEAAGKSINYIGVDKAAIDKVNEKWGTGFLVHEIPKGTLPHAATMGAVGIAALVANAASFGLLWAYRGGDANMRSAWVCTRNDVLGNLAVLLAALGVFGTGTGWPDVIVAAIMAGLALQGAWLVLQHSRNELRVATLVA